MDKEDIEFAIRIVALIIVTACAITLAYLSLNAKAICPMYMHQTIIDEENKKIYAVCNFDKYELDDYELLCRNYAPVKYENTYWYEINISFNRTNNSIPNKIKIG